MKKLALTLASLLTVTTLNSYANDLAIDIGDDTFSIEFSSKSFSKDSEFSIATLHADDLHLYSVKGLVTGNLEQNRNFEAALGGKVYALSFQDDNIQGLALGGELNYKLPMNEKVEFNGSIYYAPSPTLSDDLDYLADLTLTASYKLLNNGAIYINYRKLQASDEFSNDLKMNSGFNIGLNFSF